MATSRTGTGAWKNTQRAIIAKAKNNNTPCAICGEAINYLSATGPDTPEVDHIIPHKLGGTDDKDNLQVTHRACNRRKGGRNTTNTPPVPDTHATRFPHSRAW